MSKHYVVLRMPEDAWETLRETLKLDSVSKAFDRELRKKISAALAKVEALETLDAETLKADRKREREEDAKDAAIARQRLKTLGRK